MHIHSNESSLFIIFSSENLICYGSDEIVIGGCASGRYNDCWHYENGSKKWHVHSIWCCQSGLKIRQVSKVRQSPIFGQFKYSANRKTFITSRYSVLLRKVMLKCRLSANSFYDQLASKFALLLNPIKVTVDGNMVCME